MLNAIPQYLVALDYHGIILEWEPAKSKSSEIAGYHLYMKVDNGDWEQVNTYLINKDNRQFILNWYNPHSKYQFRVVAVDLDGNQTTKIVEFPS